MKSVEDFIQILNELKEERYAQHAFPITKKQLYYYASNKVKIEDLYTENYIPKKSGGTRKIKVPCRGLKEIQQYIAECLNAIYEPDPCIMGFVKGKSIIDNATPHIGHKYLLTWDIKDYFTSLHAKLVKYCLVRAPFNFPDDVANLVTNICTIRISENSYKRILPQGAPTSPILSNIVFSEADKIIKFYCGERVPFYLRQHRNYPITYTRYADDLTFSSDYDFYYDNRFSWYSIKRLFRKRFRENLDLRPFYYLVELKLNKKKTTKCKPGQRKLVTGIVVNEKLNVRRSYVREIRDLLYIWEKYGYTDAQKRFSNHVKKTSHISTHSELLNVLVGKINFIKQVKGKDDLTYLRFKEKLEELCSIKNSNKLVTVKLKSGLVIKGQLINIDLEKGLVISIAGIKKLVNINSISEIIEE